MIFSIVRLLLTSAIVLVGAAASAQEAWPNRPIKLLVTSAAGGGIDLMARITAEGMSRVLPQRVFVENNGTAGGLIAARTIAKSDPDGYTFLFSGPGQASLPFIFKNPGYDVRADFASVSLVTSYPLVIVTNPSLPARSAAEFIALAKANPGKYSFGSSGIGGTSHIPLEAFKFRAGIDMVHVPYRGSGQTTAALLGGQVDLVIDGLAPQLGNIREGRVRALGLTSKARHPDVPEIPTISETLPGFEFPMWVAIYAPAKTPRAVIDKMTAAVKAGLAMPFVQTRFKELLVDPVGSTPEELDRFMDDQLAFNKDVITKAQINVQE